MQVQLYNKQTKGKFKLLLQTKITTLSSIIINLLVMKLKFTLFTILSLFIVTGVIAQNTVKPHTGTVKLLGEFAFEETDNSFSPSVLTVKQAPKPGTMFSHRKALLDAKRQKHIFKPTKNTLRKSGTASTPIISFQTLGNNQNGTPNDNDLAVSNGGIVVSVLNSNMRVIDETGKILKNFTLKGLGQIGGFQSSTFDPRIVYDPIADRFIIVFLNGRDDNSNTYVCFSKTNDPTQDWFAYALQGSNLFENNTWSDYPIISISEEDLFITLNMLGNGQGWRDGFRESMIWQISKKEGYDGDTALKFNRWNNIKFGNRNVWSICPVQGGSKPTGPNSYFLSVRPTDFQNDSMFVTEITNTLSSGNATLSTRLIKTSRMYGFPPNAPQGNGEWLSTNDGRVLTAMIENDMIQFAGNCVDTNNYTAGIFHGYFKTNANTATLNIISSDTVDYGYPDIAYAGIGEPWDNSAMLTISRVTTNTPSGTAVIHIGRDLTYSTPVIVRSGTAFINQLGDTLERWGDYAGIQRKYNEPGTFWLSGSIGYSNSHGTVIAKVSNSDPALSTTPIEKQNLKTTVYPNPTAKWLTIEFDLPQKEVLAFSLYDINGKLVTPLLKDKVKAGLNKFTFNTAPLASGIYFLSINGETETYKYEKIIVGKH